MAKKFYVVCYDIKDNSRRTKVFKIMRNYGTRVQYSVFECILEKEVLQRMLEKVSETIKKDEDSVRIYYIPYDSKKFIKIVGVGEVSRDQKYFIV